MACASQASGTGGRKRRLTGLIARAGDARRASPADSPPGSRPARPRCRTRRGASSAVQRSVSSSSQAARGSPSRGWPGRAGVDQPLALREVQLGRPPCAWCPTRARPPGGRRTARRGSGRSARRGSPWRRSTARRSARTGRTPRSGRAGRRGRARRPRRSPSGLSESRNSRVSGRITSRVHVAASAAPRENSSSESTSTTARSWLPARQTAQWRSAERDAGVGLAAVADEVAEAPQLLGAVALGGVDHGLEGVAIAVDVGRDGDAHAAYRLFGAERLRLPIALVTALVVAEAAVVAHAAARSAGPIRSTSRREPTSARRRSRRREPFRTGQLWICVARMAIELGRAGADRARGRRGAAAAMRRRRCWPARRPPRRSSVAIVGRDAARCARSRASAPRTSAW